jgi:uncharacterized protein (TIGR04255 family)
MPVLDNEIYPNAPLELAAFELRIAHSLALAERGTQAQVYERLRERLPITQPQAGLQVAIGGPMMAPQQPLRLLDRERGESVVIGPETIVVESTSYRCYADFCGLLTEVLAAIAEQGLAGFTRIGLRYINEVRRPGAGEPADWEGLVHPALLAGASLAKEGMNAQRVSGEIEFATSSKHSVVMRYGLFTGRVVAVEGPLRTRTSETGPAFLIDLDSYWEEPAGQRLPEFSIDAVMNTTTQLREPIHELFELAITDELRQTFREEQPS